MLLLRVAVPLASFLSFSAFAVAQVSLASCTSTSESWLWAYNSFNQDPCTVSAYMYATCNGGNFTVYPLTPGDSYNPPWGDAVDDLCYCSTVGYSLISACAACQDGTFAAWSEWVAGCTKTSPPSSFPNPVPSGIRVPHWALLNVTTENIWDPNESYAAGDTPEVLPGSVISPTPHPGSKSSSAAAIAGGLTGGVAAIAIVICAIFYLRRRSQAPPVVSAGVDASQSQRPLSDQIPLPGSPSSCGSPMTMRFYDPNDRTTFPGYEGSPHSPDISSQAHMSSYYGTGSSLGHTQTSLPQAMGYHGHPIV